MLASAGNNIDKAHFKCLTVGSYGEQAFQALPFLKPETTCPCLLQRLCYLVADDKAEEGEVGAIEDKVVGSGDELESGDEESADETGKIGADLNDSEDEFDKYSDKDYELCPSEDEEVGSEKDLAAGVNVMDSIEPSAGIEDSGVS